MKLVPVERVGIPEFPANGDFRGLFKALYEINDVPGYVVFAGVDDPEGVALVDQIEGFMRGHGGKLDRQGVVLGAGGFGEFGWHFDEKPGDDGKPTDPLTVSVHNTRAGGVRAELVVPGPAFWNLEHPADFSLSKDHAAQLDAVEADPELFIPKIYTGKFGPAAELGAAAVLVFRLNGTVHRFRDIDPSNPRISAARFGAVPLSALTSK